MTPEILKKYSFRKTKNEGEFIYNTPLGSGSLCRIACLRTSALELSFVTRGGEFVEMAQEKLTEQNIALWS